MNELSRPRIQSGGIQSIPADPAATATVEDMRLSEVIGIHTRLGRICASKQEGKFLRRAWKMIEWDRVFGALAVLFIGAAVGGGIALVPLLNVETDTGQRAVSDRALIEYSVALAVCVLIGLFCVVARMAIKSEREDSVMAIYTDFGGMLARYETSVAALPTNELGTS